MNHLRKVLSLLVLLVAIASPTAAFAETADRELTVHGFRSPSMGIELREGFLGFHLGAFALLADKGDDGPRTTWFLKTGLTAYPWRFDLGSGRPSGPFVSLSLLQGLNNEWNVAKSASQGSGVHGELGFRWAVVAGLDLRLGIGVLVGNEKRVNVHPTPGIGWSVAL